MSKRNHLIATSAIISLMLFNANTTQAETNQDVPAANHINEVQEFERQEETKLDIDAHEFTEETFKELIEEIKTQLNEEQQVVLEELITEQPEILQEAFIHHQKGEFELAVQHYEVLLSDNEHSEEATAFLELFKELATDHTYLTDYAPEETDQEAEDQKGTAAPSTEDEETTEPATETSQGQELEESEREEDEPGSESVEETEENPEKDLVEDPKQQPKSVAQEKAAPRIQTFSAQAPSAGEPILSEKSIKYEAKLARPTDGINTKPYGTAGFETIRLVDNWVGRRVRVTKEAVTPRATWSYIRVIGTNISGWVDKAGLDIEAVTFEKDVSYSAVLTRSTDGINTRPYGTEGHELVRTVGDWVGKQVRVTKEAVTPRSTWAYIEVPGTNVKGWIDTAGIEKGEPILSEKAIQYEGKLARRTDGINTKPYGTAGFQTIRLVNDWVGKRVRVTKEAVTPRATWAYVRVVGTNVSGWVDKAGIDIESITSEKEVAYDAVLTRATDGINTRPYGTEGYELIRTVGDWVGKQVRVTKEAVTPRSTWAYIEVPGTDVMGWIDMAGLKKGEPILSEKAIQYEGKLARPTDGINTKPYGTVGYKTIRLVDDWVDKRVSVTKEAITPRSTWAYVRVAGTDVSGWIDKAGIEIEKITSEKNVDYTAYLTRPTDGINTKPYGTEGYEIIRLVDDLVGSEVRVAKEAQTPRSTFAFINVVGTDISGWIDKAGISQGTIAYRTTLYPTSFEEALDRQMAAGYPQTDAYGGGWNHAKREDVAYYLNPENFVSDVSLPNVEYVQISTGALNVRKGPGTNYGRVATVNRNEVYEFLDESNGWIKINLNGTTGWVSKSYVSLISSVQYKNVPNGRLATVTASALNLRQGPSASHDRVGLVYNGATYKVLEDANGWYKLDANGTVGWASGSYLNIRSEIDSDKLQFLSLSSPSGISVADMNKELKGKGILEGQGAAFIEASQTYNINEIYLLSHALLETGHGASKLATGVEVNGKTVYNMFGIGAYDGVALEAGSQYAYAQGWDTPAKAIVGGAEFIAETYINSPVHKQDTLYKMKWNPANPTSHQYATDIGWAVKQTNSLNMITEYSDRYNLVLKFDIPLYN